jgi:ABC-type phosphate transport system auxiliary subunit
MADALESRVTALEAKLKDIEEQPVSGSVEFRLSRQIKRLDHKIDIVGADVSELREEFALYRGETDRRFASLEDDMAKVLVSLNRIFDKLDKLDTSGSA